MKRIISILLMLTVWCQIVCSCQKEKACGVNNPKRDLPWMKGYTVIPVGHVRIYQCTYRDGIGFLIEPVDCIDGGYELVNCEGKYLCILWGLTGNPCTEYNIDFKHKKLIWNKRK